MTWLLELGVLALVARAGSDTFRRLGINPLVGEIAFGFVLAVFLGLTGLNLDAHVLEIFSELGILFMLFLIGLETELKQLLRVGVTAFAVGALGIVLPFAAGLGVGSLYGFDRATSLFLACALMATSVAATVRIFMEMDYVNNVASRVVLAAAVIDDILGLLIFALVLAFTDSSGASVTAKILGTGGFLFVVLPVLWLVLPRANDFMARMAGEESKDLAMIALALLVAYLAHAAGLAAIIGAFAFGMLLNRSNIPQMHALIKPFYLLFAPVFFLSIGLGMDAAAMGSSILFGLTLTAAAVLSKLAAAFAGARITGMPWRESLLVGLAMVPRGEVGLIIAAIGSKMGIVSQEVFAGTAFMCIATVLVVPYPLKKMVGIIRRREEVLQ